MIKLLTMLGATALMSVGVMAPEAASAQHHRTEVHSRTVTYHSGRPHWGTRKVCTTKWRHHRKVRVCRTVRYRR